MFEAAPQSFGYSETSITRGKQRMLALLLALAILVAATFIANGGGSAFVLGVIVFGIVPLGYVQHRWMERNVRRLRLQLRTDGILRESGAIRQILPWSDVARVVLHHSPRGEVRAIELFAVTQRPMLLAGYEHLADISGLIQAQRSPLVAVETKRRYVDLEHPCSMFVFVVLVGFAALTVVTTWDWNPQLLSGACQVVLGLMFLLQQPLARQTPNLRMGERVLAGGMIGYGLISLLIAAT